MTKFVAGFITGIVVATVGINGILNVAQKGIDTVKTQSHELAKPTAQ